MLTEPRKLLSWFLSQGQDWTKGSPANPWYLFSEEFTYVFLVFPVLAWVYTWAYACTMSVAAADDLLARRTGKVLWVMRAELLVFCFQFHNCWCICKPSSSLYGWLSAALFLSLGEIPEDNILLLLTLLAECIPVEFLQPFASLVHCVSKAVER